MTRRTSFAIVVLLALTVTCQAVVAHEGHDHRILGTVTMAAADHVMLKDRAGKAITVKVTKDTKVKATPAVKVEEIAPGTRVVITATQAKDKTFIATVIQVGAPAAK